MKTNFTIPWSRINDFLMEIGTARNFTGFRRQVMTKIASLIPFDQSVTFGNIDSQGLIKVEDALGVSSKWVDSFNHYYYQLVPPIDIISLNCRAVNWLRFGDNEFVSGFIRPQGIGYSLELGNLGHSFDSIGTLAIHRSKRSSPFSETEQTILEIIQPHLSNFYAIYSLLAVYDAELPDTAKIQTQFPCLTQREAEIVALLCRRFSTGMIASQLHICPATVYRHLANIFAKLEVFNRDELTEKISKI